jgi:hypothetical protein
MTPLDIAIENEQRNIISQLDSEEKIEKIMAFMIAGGVKGLDVVIKTRVLFIFPHFRRYRVSLANIKGDPTILINKEGIFIDVY